MWHFPAWPFAPAKVACMSTLVRNMVDDSGTDEEIPLPNATSLVFPECRHLPLCSGRFRVAFLQEMLGPKVMKPWLEVKTAILSKAQVLRVWREA